jgi:hypothetical protein
MESRTHNPMEEFMRRDLRSKESVLKDQIVEEI